LVVEERSAAQAPRRGKRAGGWQRCGRREKCAHWWRRARLRLAANANMNSLLTT